MGKRGDETAVMGKEAWKGMERNGEASFSHLDVFSISMIEGKKKKKTRVISFHITDSTTDEGNAYCHVTQTRAGR